MRKLLLAVATALFSCTLASAQTLGTGDYAHSSVDKRGFDTVNLGNLNTYFSIPIFSKAGRGQPFTYAIQGQGMIWSPVSNGSTTVWTPDPSLGFTGLANGTAFAGYTTHSTITTPCGSASRSGSAYVNYKDYNYIYHESSGANHLFNYTYTSGCTNGNGTPSSTGDGSSSDGSGYALINGGPDVQTRNGWIIAAADSSSSTSVTGVTDTNGNRITANGSGSFTDTLGVTALTSSGTNPTTLTYPVIQQQGGATTAQVTLAYRSYTLRTHFQCSGIGEYGSNAVNLLDHITLADGSQYSFAYEGTPGATDNAVTGRLASITLPTRGVIQYSYSGGSNGIICSDGSVSTLTRTTTDGVRTYQRTAMSASGSSTSVTDEQNNQTSYTFSIDSVQLKYFETHRRVFQGSASTGKLLQEVMTCYNGSSASCDGTSISLPITEVDVTSSFNGGSQLLTKASYDAQGVNILTSAMYGAGASLLEKTSNTYSNLNKLLTTNTSDGMNKTISAVTYGYDESTPTPTSGVPQHLSVSGPRGNLTSTHTSLDGSSTNVISTSAAYYDTGMPLSSTDPGGFATTYSYDPTQTFTTSLQVPTPSSGVALSTGASYDSTSGALLSQTGMNSGQTLTVNQYDPLLRPTSLSTPDGGLVTASYNPTQIGTHIKMDSSNTTDQETFLDGYGRVARMAVASSSGWYLTDSCYNPTGSLQYQSTAYLSSSQNPSGNNCSSSTATQYTYDALGRQLAVTTPDGSSVGYTYQSRAVKMISNGVTRITQYDLLGRISQVCEVSPNTLADGSNPSTCPGDISATGYATTYSYNLNGHATTVVQGGQQRTFATDAAGRTTQTNEPEAGIVNYTYAYNKTGLIVTRTRPTANQTSATVLTTTKTQYDALGRIVSITYSDGTPTKNFGYDAAGNGGTLPSQGSSKGQMTSYLTASSSVPVLEARNFVYDIMGRVSETVDCLPGYCGSLPPVYRWYGYDLASNLVAEKYSTATGGGSAATQTYTYNIAGQLASVIGTQGSGSNGAASYSTNPNTMTPFGPALTELGNSLYTTYTYGPMGNLSAGWTCSGSQQPGCSGGQTIYSFTATAQGGQVTQSSDTVTGPARNYNYDEFGRLKSLSTVSGATPAFAMNLAYDWWGNRWQQNVTAGSGPQPQLSFNTSNNHIASTGYVYDAVGNLLNDGLHSYTYDAENNLTQVDKGATATYQYGALNERRLATWNGQTQAYDTDLQGRRATTWVNTSNSVGTVQFYAGKQKHAYWSSSDNNFHFEHTDWLGTVRVRTNSTGSVEGSYQSLPFGDGTTVSGGDNSLNHFTGLDADVGATAGLSHAGSREYSTSSGRWTSPDSYLGSYDFGNPQSLNRYTYVLNSPLSNTDPSGQECVYADGSFDDQSDPFTGDGGGYGDDREGPRNTNCSQAGGMWIDHSYFVDNGLPDWSSQPNAALADMTIVSATTTTSPDNSVSLDVPMEVWSWASKQTTPPSGPWVYGNYGGSGGAGVPINDADAGAMMHDYCYDQHKFKMGSNFRASSSDLQACNQALCDTETKVAAQMSTPTTPSEFQELKAAFDMVQYFTFLVRPGNACHLVY